MKYMKMKTSVCLFLMFCLMLPAFARPAKGFQVVLFHAWSDTSLKNFVSSLKAANADKDIKLRTVEISSAPFLAMTLPDHTDPNVGAKERGRFDNLLYLIQELTATDVNMGIYVTVYMSLHEEGLSDADLRSNTDRLRKQFIDEIIRRGKLGKIRLSICPSLEDTLGDKNGSNPDAFTNKVKVIASRLSWEFLSSGRVSFRRSISPGASKQEAKPGAVSIEQKRTLDAKGNEKKTRSFAIEHEVHSPVKLSSAYKMWSNDGVFVYLEPDDPKCVIDDNVKLSPQSLGDFKKTSFRPTKNLWRPAYNLFPQATNKDGSRATPFCSKKVDRSKRSDSDTQPLFDAHEQNVVKEFLKR